MLERKVQEMGFNIIQKDLNRPWGGFFVVSEGQIAEFKNMFFPELELTSRQMDQKLSPKFLIVAPHKRLSWQYHFRREEVWKLIAGASGIVRSNTDEQVEASDMKIGELVVLDKGERHRLIGKNNWGLVAEIWMHTDPDNPSDEDDIVRLQDDYSRK
ncbi:cupin domain-containing protein [Cognataquiflexum nitidum]|uniref:cupin domain-containing protein n=1 Tax=Cognataquiflexum nitidum TaxID=2922272 RepID=UPI001F13EE07|nr:phosphoheptose isomerase [Cognataquiflexum nitidum]